MEKPGGMKAGQFQGMKRESWKGFRYMNSSTKLKHFGATPGLEEWQAIQEQRKHEKQEREATIAAELTEREPIQPKRPEPIVVEHVEPEPSHRERAGPKTKADTADAAYFSQLPHDTVRKYMEVLGAVKWGVYQYVLTFRNIHSGVAYPSLPTIAEGTGVSVSSVQRALTTLYGKDGLLKAHGLPPLLTRTKHEPDSEKDKSRKRGGRPVNEYGFPVYEKDLDRIARFAALERKSKP